MKLLIFLIAAGLGAQTKDFNVNMRVLGTLDTTGSTATKPFRTVSSDQSGSCSVPNEAVLNSLNGKVFVCAVSTWAQISASGTPSFDPQAANRIFAGPATGADSVPAFRALVAADMPATFLPNTRLINTASPLGGGGALTGDLTLTCSTCIISSGSYGDPAWLTSLDASKVSGTLGTVTLTNGTGLPVSTGISGLGTGVATFLATPSSANLASAVTNETGTGALVFATDPTFTLTDVTTNNATTSQHGWLPKLGGGTSNFLRADGTWAVPSGSGDVVAAGTNTYTGYNNFSGGSMKWPESTIAGRPSASGIAGQIRVMTDAASNATGCDISGGSARVPCISNGTSWIPISPIITAGTGTVVSYTGMVAVVGIDSSATLSVAGVTATGPGAGAVRVCDSTDTYCWGIKGSAARTTSLDVAVPTADPTANQFRVCSAASGGSCTESWLSMPLTTKGDLWVTSGGTAMNRLAVGTDGQVLTADAASTNGVRWAAGGGGISYIERHFPFAGGAGSSAVALVGYSNFGAACPSDATLYSSTGGPCYLYGYDSGTEHNAVIVRDQVPSGWTSGAVTFTLWFAGNASGGNTVQMKAETACVATTENYIPASYNASQNFASQASTAGKVYSSTITLTMTGCAAGEVLYVRMTRVDTTGYAAWYSANIKYTIP